MRSRRGISPIVAAILLVGITITIGVLVSGWISSWVGQKTRETDIACSVNTNYQIDSAVFNDTGSNNTVQIRIINRGSQALYGFGVVLDNGTHIAQFNSSSSQIGQGGVSKANPLQREQAAYISVNLTNSTNQPVLGATGLPALGATLTEIRVTNDACNTVSQSTTAITKKP